MTVTSLTPMCAMGVTHASTVVILYPPTPLTMITVGLFSPKPLEKEAHCPMGVIRTTDIFLNESIDQFSIEKQEERDQYF